MADQELPEVQPSGRGRGKQVVFLFMSAAVYSIVIFLLGVSVGRGVRKSGAPTDAGEAGDTTVAATPAVKTAPADLSSHDVLPGAANDAATSAKAPASAPPGPPPPTVGDAPPTKPTSAPPTKPPSASPARPTSALPPQTDRSAPAAHGEYTLQVGAFTTLKAAQSLVARVKAKDTSYPVSTLTLPESEPGPRFRVIVGPYPTRADAGSVMDRLKKDGFGAIIKF